MGETDVGQNNYLGIVLWNFMQTALDNFCLYKKQQQKYSCLLNTYSPCLDS